MFNNNPYGNFGQQQWIPQGTGYQFNGGQPAAQKINNVLTAEEIQRLVQKENQLSLQLTEKEVLRAKCNHRRADGLDDAIVEDPVTGLARCQICGYEFRPVEDWSSPEIIQDSVNAILDILQTIKIIYTTMPADVAAEYFQIIPLIEKIPELFKYAVKDYTKRVQYDPYTYNNKSMGVMNLFNMLCGGMGQPAAYNPQMDPNVQQAQPQFNPAFGAGYAAPQFAAAPQYVPGYGMPMSNGFGVPAQGYAPQTAGFQYNPQPQVAPQAAAPATDAATQTTTETFKA